VPLSLTLKFSPLFTVSLFVFTHPSSNKLAGLLPAMTGVGGVLSTTWGLSANKPDPDATASKPAKMIIKHPMKTIFFFKIHPLFDFFRLLFAT
jgi:hypothetical protein